MQNKDELEDDKDEKNSKNDGKKPIKTVKKGIIYITNIPKHMNVTLIRENLDMYSKVCRIYLQPEKSPTKTSEGKLKKKRKFSRHYTEGWVELARRKDAKKIAAELNNQRMSLSKGSRFYDNFWCMKYLPGFKWVHLAEKLHYESQVHKQRLRMEISQARAEASFFQDNLDRSEKLQKKGNH